MAVDLKAELEQAIARAESAELELRDAKEWIRKFTEQDDRVRAAMRTATAVIERLEAENKDLQRRLALACQTRVNIADTVADAAQEARRG